MFVAWFTLLVMSDASRLSAYFAKQSVKRLKLEGALAAHIDRVLALLDQEIGQVKVADVHAALFPFSSAASANKSLNSMQRQLNEFAEARGNPLRMQVTTAKSGGAGKRFVWFEGPASAPPPTRTAELDSIPRGLLVDSRGTDPGAPVVVLISYNEHETAAVMARFSPTASPPTEAREGRSFSVLGNFNGWRLVHLVSRQGEDHSQLSTSKAIGAWEPAAVIGVGIAFGVDRSKQDIGDVLVSESIQGYELARVNEGGSITPRETGRPASGWLVQRLLTCHHQRRSSTDWPALHFGVVLSGSKLVDDLDYRDTLVGLFPQGIIGGEMEGVGLALAADDAKVDWLVVKGICDWADGKKNTASKDRDQRLAADNAVAVVAEALRECPQPGTFQTIPSADGGNRRRVTTVPSSRLMGMKDFDTIEPALLIDAPLGMPSSMDKDGPALPRSLDRATSPRGLDSNGGVDVMSALHSWVEEPDAPPVFAVLGEYGMGKTVTAQRLARELEAKREQDPTRPGVLYFDLRSVTGLDKGVPTLGETVEECMARTWIADEDPAAYTWSNVLAWLTAGAVVIFDGLDEVLVKLDAGDGQTFTRTLLNIVDEQRRRAGRARVLVTCRTQYFRTLREQSNHFSGQERGNTREDSYRSLVLLPLTEAQVLAYLTAAVPGSQPRELLDMLRSVHDLTDLTHRPYTLTLVSQFLPDIEADRAAGRTVYGVNIYRRMVARWLERDAGKHHLRPEDKVELAQRLAAHLHRTGAGLLDATDLEDWMHAWLDATPRLARRYTRLHPDQLEEDLRTATFLTRIDGGTGSGFRFAHTSLAEYFHACYLQAALVANDPGAWDISPPSPETLDFLGQLLAERPESRELAHLTTWGRNNGGKIARLVLEFSLVAAARGWPCPSMRGINLRGEDLRSAVIAGSPGRQLLDLREADLRGALLDFAIFRKIDARGARLEKASAVQACIEDSLISSSDWKRVVTTELAFIRVDQVPLESAASPKGTVCVVQGDATSTKGPRLDMHRLVWSSPSSEEPIALAFSRDGSQLASAYYSDSSIYIWNPVTARVSTVLFGHFNSISSLSFGPWPHLASASLDGTVRLWDVEARVSQAISLDGSGENWRVQYSPCGSHVLGLSSSGLIATWDSRTGARLASIPRNGFRRFATYNTDGSLIALGSSEDGVLLISPRTGELVDQFPIPKGAAVVTFGASPSFLITSSLSGELEFLDTKTRSTTRAQLCADGVPASLISVGANHSTLTGWLTDGTLRVWRVSPDENLIEEVCSIMGTARAWPSALCSATGRVAAVKDKREIRVWNAKGRAISELASRGTRTLCLTYTSPDGTIAAAGSDGAVRLWTGREAQNPTVLRDSDNMFRVIASDATGGIAAASGHAILVWGDLTNSPPLRIQHRASNSTDVILAIQFDSSRRAVVAGDDGGYIRSWSLHTGELLYSVHSGCDVVENLALSKAGSIFATGSGSRKFAYGARLMA